MTPADQEFLDALADEIEDLHANLPHAQSAEILVAEADQMEPGARGRAALLSHAGEQWELADRPELARTCYERAIEDGGIAWIDARVQLLSTLFALGETGAAESLLEELWTEVRSGRPLDGPVHDFVGEELEEQERYDEALRWFTVGIRHAERNEEDDLGCLSGRYRVRRALGLPHDRYDDLAEEQRQRMADDLAGPPESSEGRPANGHPSLVTVLFWPEREFSAVLERWPHARDDYGSTVAEHRTTIEKTLRELAAPGLQVAVGRGRLPDYLEHAERVGEDPADAGTRSSYAAEIGRLGQATPWPPGRNDPCWCGSGAKYKKCCGALRV